MNLQKLLTSTDTITVEDPTKCDIWNVLQVLQGNVDRDSNIRNPEKQDFVLIVGLCSD